MRWRMPRAGIFHAAASGQAHSAPVKNNSELEKRRAVLTVLTCQLAAELLLSTQYSLLAAGLK